MRLKTDQDKRIASDRRLLSQTFPKCFTHGAQAVKLPLKIGIVADVLKVGVKDEKGEPLSGRRIRQAIFDYCQGPRYHLAVLERDVRVGIDGAACEPVQPTHREWSRRQIERFAPKWHQIADAIMSHRERRAA